jgi:hypothetical protein
MKKANELAEPGTSLPVTNDPDLPAELSEQTLARGRRGAFLPTDPVARAQRLEARVKVLQEYGGRLRQAAERVCESALPESALPESASHYRVSRDALDALRKALFGE